MRETFSGIFWPLLLVLFFYSLHEIRFSLAQANGISAEEMVPMVGQGKSEIMVMMNDRRKLNSFQICSMCTCCGGANKHYCLPSPCCYAINCNIPNRPFGFCSFTPKTCNCFGCHI